MKKDTRIIPFPDRSGAKRAKRADLRHLVPPKYPLGLVKSETIVHLLPNIAGYYDLINEQCDILMDALSALLSYMKNGDKEDADKIEAIARRTKAIGRYHLDMLGRTSTHTTVLVAIAQVSVALNLAIEYIRITAGKFLDLNIPVDHFMLEIAEENLNFARALSQGFYKLGTDQLQIEQDIHAALDAKAKIEKTYHRALAALSADKEVTKHKRTRCEYQRTMPEIFSMLERRDAYHTLFKSAKRLTWAVNRLQGMSSYTGTRI